MSLSVHKGIPIKRLTLFDPDFHIVNGIAIIPRAGFEVSQFCPTEYADIINEAYNHGWIKPYANVNAEWFEREIMWNHLKN